MGTDLRVDETHDRDHREDCSRAESPSCTRPAAPPTEQPDLQVNLPVAVDEPSRPPEDVP